jgi:hypothetical protein
MQTKGKHIRAVIVPGTQAALFEAFGLALPKNLRQSLEKDKTASDAARRPRVVAVLHAERYDLSFKIWPRTERRHPASSAFGRIHDLSQFSATVVMDILRILKSSSAGRCARTRSTLHLTQELRSRSASTQ